MLVSMNYKSEIRRIKFLCRGAARSKTEKIFNLIPQNGQIEFYNGPLFKDILPGHICKKCKTMTLDHSEYVDE